MMVSRSGCLQPHATAPQVAGHVGVRAQTDAQTGAQTAACIERILRSCADRRPSPSKPKWMSGCLPTDECRMWWMCLYYGSPE